MIEVLRHTFGLCGEGHPHLLTLTPLLVGIVRYYHYISHKIKTLCKKIWYRCTTIWGMQQEDL